MNWTRPIDIKAKVRKWWDSGELLAQVVTKENDFPRRIRLKAPATKEMTDRFDEVRAWIADIRTLTNCEIEMNEINHRILGKNSIPSAVLIRTVDDALAIVGKRKDAAKFQSIVDLIATREPALLTWTQKRPHKALELYEHWKHLLAIVRWIREHPDPGIYLRQIDLPGVHTKLIEEHRSVLSELLDIVLPASQIDFTMSGVSQFARRYGFIDKPLKIRFRILDPDRMLLSTIEGAQDITLDRESFSNLSPPVTKVFITENEINYLAFPEVKGGMVIFGAGYCFDVLAGANWLLGCQIYYWGDIDTHGFNILNTVRKELPHIRSILMDEDTLLSHRELWGTEDTQHGAVDLHRLTENEHAVYTKLKSQVWGANVRLEQERIGWHHVESKFEQALFSDSHPQSLETSLSDKDIREFLKPSKCEVRVYLNSRTLEEKPRGEFENLLGEWSRKARLAHRATFSEIMDLSAMSSAERKTETNKAIQEQHDAIYKPLLTARRFLDGIDTEIRGEPDFLIKSEDKYIIRNISMARRINQEDHPELFLEICLHGWLLEETSGTAPARLEICGGDGTIHSIAYDGGSSPLKTLAEIAVIRRLPEQPYSPVGWTKCSECAFHDYCWQRAEEAHDVSIIAGIDQQLARSLRRLGCFDIESLIRRFDDETLSILQSRGSKSRVGNRASKVLQMATAALERKHIVIDRNLLPQGQNFAVIDFEGLPPHLNNDTSVYLWGCQVFGDNPGDYMTAIVDCDTTDDAGAWFMFLDNVSQILEKYGDIVFLHWHHYERTMLTLYRERHGDRSNFCERILHNSRDLKHILQDSVALPLPSYSLKVVEKYVGFERTQKQYGGNWAIVKFIESMELSDDKARREILGEILNYNREDLLATWNVFTWIKDQVSKLEVI